MLFGEIVKMVDGKILYQQNEKEFTNACATDMLSELLAVGKEKAILLTGLCTPQMINTADIVGIGAVIVVRGKNIPFATIKRAQELDIPLAVTSLTMFSTCGRLFCNGLKDVNEDGKKW